MKNRLLPALVAALFCTLLWPLRSGAEEPPAGFSRVELSVDGVAREALVYAPPTAKTTKTPLVFVFHGHGGTARGAVRGFAMNREWPEAISVYPQGLNTPGRLTDPEGKRPGWQHSAGAQDDRDLKFFDALLARLKQDFAVDEKRVFSTGHSNGGGFTYLLWAERGEVFAAMAPSAAAAAGAAPKLKPKPAMHLAGEKDPLVKYEWQMMMMNAVRKLNDCAPEGTAWAEQCILYPSSSGTPFVTYIHPGGHQFTAESPALIAKFFREQAALK